MDLQYAWRSLSRTPGFCALVILTLALGIGATTTMFSTVWAVFLRPLPFPAQDRLVTVWQNDPRVHGTWQRVTPANFVDWEAQTDSFEALGVLPNWTGEAWPFNVVTSSGMERVRGIYASSGFFKVLGVAPMLGRVLERDEDRTRGKRMVVISHAYWQARFGGDPSVVSKVLEVDTFRGGDFTIVGVMPPGFDFPRGTSIWLSLADWGGGPMPGLDDPQRCCPWYTVFGRLKRNVTIERARGELTTIAQRVSARHPDATPATSARVVSLRETLVGSHQLTLFGLFGAVGCILLIGSANVANLLLSRGVSRRREVLTRLALGATRWRLARQLLAESLLLGVLGAAVGLLLSLWAQDVVASRVADRVPLIDETHFDWIVLGFAVTLTLAVTTICGLVPLIDWRAVDWNARGQTESRTSRRLRHAMVVGELAIAVAVVATAGLLVRTVANLRSVQVGFETGRTLIVSTDLTSTTMRERRGAARFVEQVLPRIAALPGVRAAAATTGVPLETAPAEQAITRQGDPIRPSASSPQVTQTAVTPDYFRAMGITLTRGRLFTEDDRSDGALVAVLNETAARRYWPGEDPIGKRFAMGSGDRFGSFRAVQPGEIEWREIVGVVSDVRSGGFASNLQPEVYYSYKQYPLYDPALIVRTAGDPTSMIQSIRTVMEAVNNRAVITRVRTLDAVADESIAAPRLRATLATLFSALALMLGMLGIYGLMSYTVAQRTREIGLRVALGATRAQVARMIMGKALRLAVIGVGVGLVVAYAAARWISALFFGVSPADAVTLVSACLFLIAGTIAASAYPLRHALRVEPAVALRND
jgi:putative ABC transport system permease protein